MKNQNFEIRTDLALEERESFEGDQGEVRGVVLKEWEKGDGIKLTQVRIMDRKGAKAMGKPEGSYLTLEAGRLGQPDPEYHRQAAAELGKCLREMIRETAGERRLDVLAVGLGNASVTPDSLGPRVISALPVTRHWDESWRKTRISAIAPGVMAQTGMETAEILQGIISRTCPDLVIAVDALAARSVARLGCTIQITDTGIHPGSGVGNHRHGLTRESLGIPVLAIGVPTVVGAAAIVHHTIRAMIQALSSHGSTQAAGTWVEQMDQEEQYQLIRELLEPEFGPMYVTPPDIDQQVRQISRTISQGIREALF